MCVCVCVCVVRMKTPEAYTHMALTPSQIRPLYTQSEKGGGLKEGGGKRDTHKEFSQHSVMDSPTSFHELAPSSPHQKKESG